MKWNIPRQRLVEGKSLAGMLLNAGAAIKGLEGDLKEALDLLELLKEDRFSSRTTEVRSRVIDQFTKKYKGE